MTKLSEVVNVVPVIAKADSLTMIMEERDFSKQRIHAEPNMIPFAVVGSERNVLIDGMQVRGRKNRWGVINIEDENHCEFRLPQELPHAIHYEAFRSKQLLALKENAKEQPRPAPAA